MNVTTTKGELPIESLRVLDSISYEGSARVVATEWFLGDELVRRDVHVSILSGVESKSEQGGF